MTRRQRTRILVEGSDEFRLSLCREIESRHRVIELEAPNDGLVMVRMREPARRSRFFLGEVLVTESKVQIEGTVGLGIIAGDHPEAALQLAIIDAACNAGLPETAGWDARLHAEASRIAQLRSVESTRLMETRVSFDTMDVD